MKHVLLLNMEEKMKKIFTLLLVLMLTLSVSMVFAGGQQEEEAKGDAGKANGIIRGGELVVAKTAKMTTLDITKSMYFSNDGFVHFNVFETLINFDTDGNMIPGLASEWSVSDDGLSITLKLREDVKFTDGLAFNADACKANLDYYISEECGHVLYSLWLSNIASIDKIDEYSVRINMSNPDVTIMRTLSFSPGMMMSPESIKRKDYDKVLVGTGPFKLEEYVAGDHTILTANKDYYKKGKDGLPLPYLDKVILKFMSDDTVKTQNLQSGDIDGVDYHSSANSVLIAQNLEDVEMYQSPYVADYMLTFNLDDPQLADVRVRQAVSYAINQEEIIVAIFDGLAKKSGFTGGEKASPYYNEYDPYEYNPEKAKALLKDAGYPDGIKIKLNNISREPDDTIVQLLQQQFKASNINLVVEPLERLAWIDLIRHKFGGEIGMGVSDSPGYDYCTVYNQLLLNTNSKMIEPYKDILSRAMVAVDDEKRITIFKEYQEKILDNAIVAFLGEKSLYSSYISTVHGFAYFSNCAGDYSKTWIERE